VIAEDPITIGRYKVLNRLGAGAMGAVYLCQDPLLKRRVAVKIVLKTRADSEAMMARFQRESEISAQLNHPHIITVYDVGSDDEVGPFLTMEFVDGGSLASYLERSVVDPVTALDWLTQLGQALAAAERAGVVHRDIKPENVLVSSAGQLKLTDFGLARDDVSSLTTTGTMMGTPTHTAPELLGGARATPITDRWAFAVTAFQMVTGQLPHSGDTLSAVLHHIDREPPIIPDGTSPSLTRVFLKALHRDPARRYESILAFLTALADALGLRDNLVTKGLTVDPLASAGTASSTSTPAMSLSGETENFPLPRAAAPSGKSSEIRAPAAPNRLTRPPAELFNVAQQATEPPPQDSLHPRSSAARIPPGRTSAARLVVRAEPDFSSGLLGKIGLGLLLVLAGAGFYFWPRPLQIQTTPPGANINIDGKASGISPYDGSLTFGAHQLVISKEGFDTVSTVVAAGGPPLAITLQPYSTWVDVLTVPPGATVTLGSQAVGSSPRKGLSVPDKPTPLVISLPGYRKWQGILGPGQLPKFPIVLVKEPR
jgi:serine/threonine-protein kinase